MKHIFNIAAAAVLSCTLFASCSDFLDEKTNGQVFDNVLESQSGLEAALTGAYLQWNGFRSIYGRRLGLLLRRSRLLQRVPCRT